LCEIFYFILRFLIIVNAIYRNKSFLQFLKISLFTKPLVSQLRNDCAITCMLYVDRGCRTHFAAMANRHSWFRVLRFSKAGEHRRWQLSPRRQRSKRTLLPLGNFFLLSSFPWSPFFSACFLFLFLFFSPSLSDGRTQKSNEARQGETERVVLLVIGASDASTNQSKRK